MRSELHGAIYTLDRTHTPYIHVSPEKHPIYEWAMLGSNQRPLPFEGSKVPAAVYRRVLNMRVNKPISRQKHTSLLRSLPPFYAWVAARLLHKVTYPRDSSR
jgi:hypothetical protein